MKKFDLVILKNQRKMLDSPIKLLNRKRFYPSNSVKYLGIIVDEKSLKQHIHGIAIKLNRANTLLSIIYN